MLATPGMGRDGERTTRGEKQNPRTEIEKNISQQRTRTRWLFFLRLTGLLSLLLLSCFRCRIRGSSRLGLSVGSALLGSRGGGGRIFSHDDNRKREREADEKRPEIAQWGDVDGRGGGGGGEKKRRGRRESGGEEEGRDNGRRRRTEETRADFKQTANDAPPPTGKKKITRKFRKIRSAAVTSARRVFGSSGSGRPGSTRSG